MNKKLLKDAKAAGFCTIGDEIYTCEQYEARNITKELAKFAALQQPQWKPLETAPKTGEYILMYRKGIIKSAHWNGDSWGGDGWTYDFAENIANGFIGYLPTHWMPSPSPPINTEEK